jgi:proteasome accessory factor A
MIGRRVFGIETEFGCFVRDERVGTSETVVEAVKNYVFHKARLGLIDLTARDEAFEPARSGGFLINGGRLYIDAVGSHLEYATPECASLFDIVAHEKAGQRIVYNTLKQMNWDERVSFHNNNVDHFAGHTFGCHENYLVRTDERLPSDWHKLILPFLTTRQIFAGAGRVGGHRLEHAGFRPSLSEVADHPIDFIWVSNVYNVEPDPTVQYQLSQRADHIVRENASRVRFNRAIINPKWDSVYGYQNYQRLHLLFGEGNMSEYAAALKIGTTCLVLDLAEARAIPNWLRLQDALHTLKSISRDPTRKWIVTLLDGSTMSAIDLQRAYLQLAQKRFAGRDPETDWVLHEWEYVLDTLETDPEKLEDRLDWLIKLRILREYMAGDGRAVGRRRATLPRLGVPQHQPRAGAVLRPAADGRSEARGGRCADRRGRHHAARATHAPAHGGLSSSDSRNAATTATTSTGILCMWIATARWTCATRSTPTCARRSGSW